MMDKLKPKFLPPNTASILQPMDQSITASFKCIYRKLFLRNILLFSADGDTIIKKISRFTIKDCVDNVAESWKLISKSTLRNAWHKVGFNRDSLTCTQQISLLEPVGIMITDDQVMEIEETEDKGYGYLDDNEIIKQVIEQKDAKELPQSSKEDSLTALSDENNAFIEIDKPISTKKAIKYTKGLINFLGQDYDTYSSLIANLKKVKETAEIDYARELRQISIKDYFADNKTT